MAKSSNPPDTRARRTLERRPSALGKFTRPRPVGALARTRLFHALDEVCRHPAAWVAGPPGAGKTTLVSTYVAQRRLRSVWYRVQEDDGDPATFFHYFGLAVEAAAPGRRGAPLPHFTPEYLLNPPVFTRRYFEQAYQRLKLPCVLVLDDYQEVAQDAPLHQVLREALEFLPAGMSVIALSRREPPPALAPLRARGTIALLGGEELKLTAEECGDIARLRKIGIEKPALQQLHERTQGWTAGVVLALEQKTQPGDAALLPAGAPPQVLFDYFAGDIFGKMARNVQTLLLGAAFLPSMAAHRVVELTGEAHADRVLGELARSNYFTLKLARAHPAPAVYRFHPLFREFLLQRAQESLAPDALAKLREKAAALLEADGESADAVALLIAAGAWTEAMRVVLVHAREMLQQGRGLVLEGWLRALPDSLREQAPWALYWLGMCRLPFDPVEARGQLERAFRLFERSNDTAGVFCAWAGIIDTFVYEWAEFAPLDRWIDVLDELLGRHPRFPSPEIEARVVAGMFIALMYRQPQRSDLPQWAERLRAIVLDAPDMRTQMTLGCQLMNYYTSWIGDLGSARLLFDAVRRPVPVADLDPLAYTAWCAMEAGYHWKVGSHGECLRMLNDGLETCRRTGVQVMKSLLDTYGVAAGLASGDLTAADALLKDVAWMRNGRLRHSHYHFLISITAFYRNDSLNALASAREAVAVADEAGVPFCRALHRLGLAHALFARGERREALVHSAEARRLARRMRIANIEFECLSSAIYFLLERGKRRAAVPLLRKLMHLARQLGDVRRSFWTPKIVTRLFAVALEHGIEVEYVRGVIRRRKLAPPPEALHLEQWPFPVRIYTLGRFSVLIDGKPLEFSGKAQRKPLELLMALVAFGGRDVSERQLTEALWPDAEGDAAHQACASALHRLRKLLACDQAISLQRNHSSLNPEYVWVDVWAFERWLGRQSGVARGSAPDTAVSLYHGPFLGKEVDLAWAIPQRERLRAKFLRHLIQRGHSLFQSGEFASAIAVFEKGLNVDELAEEFYRNLMLCHQALDRRAEAIGVYQRCQKTLAAALGVAPAAKTLALYQTLRN